MAGSQNLDGFGYQTKEFKSADISVFNAAVSKAGRGVIQDYGDGFLVSESSPQALSVDVASGAALIGLANAFAFMHNQAAVTLSLDTADGTNPRDDLIVLTRDASLGVRQSKLEVVTGTPAASPSDPSLTQTEEKYQFPIARVRVGNGVSTISDSNITDLRSFAGFFTASVNVQTFTASGTWNKPVGATMVLVEAHGAGGGGGSGQTAAAGATRFGGGGGSSGIRIERLLLASDLASTVTVTVGAGGAGAAAQSGSGVSNQPGSDGGDTTFGAHVLAQGGQGAPSNTGGTASGQTSGLSETSSGTSRIQPGIAGSDATSGGVTAPSGASASTIAAGGGGGGGGVSTGNTASNAGAGGDGRNPNLATYSGGGGTAGTASGGDGGNGGDWQGGGGGAGHHSGDGGDGGDGGVAAGGGGGGGCTNGNTSGAGGDGGDGWMRVITW